MLDFTADTRFESLSDEVVHESKRILLDPIGCAVAEPKGKIGIELSLTPSLVQPL